MGTRRGRRRIALWAVLAVGLALLAPYLLLGNETLRLDDAYRARLPGAFLRCPEGRVHYEVTGPADGRPLVLLHGGLDSYPVMDRLIAALPKGRYRVIRFDFYGQGYSDRIDGRYGLSLFERQIACVTSQLGVRGRLDLVGWSLGGLVASAYAADHPEQVRSLAVVAPAGAGAVKNGAVSLAATPIVGDYLVKLMWPGLVRESIEGPANLRYSPGYVAFNRERQQTPLLVPGTRRTALSLVRDTPSFGVSPTWARLGRRGIPVLLVYGDHDPVVPPTVLPRLERDIPRLQARRIANASHGMIWDRASEIAVALEGFLAST